MGTAPAQSPAVNGAALALAYGQPVIYKPQEGGGGLAYALWGLTTSRHETRAEGVYQFIDTTASIAQPQGGIPQAMDTLTDANLNTWMIDEATLDPTSGLWTLALRREILITKHRRQT